MSVNVEIPVALSVANGVTKTFPHAFTVLDAADLTVQGELNGVTTTYTLGTHYTLTGVGTNSGSVIFGTAPASGTIVKRFRNMSLSRATDYQDNGDMLADTVNLDLDRLWLAMQEILYGAKGVPAAVRAPAGETVTELPAAAGRAGYLLGFDGAGNPVMVPGQSGTATSLALDLAANSGSGLVGYIQGSQGSKSRTVSSKQRDFVSIFDFMTQQEIDDVNTGAMLLDMTAAIQYALDCGSKTIEFFGLPMKCDQVIVPVGVWAKNINFTKYTNSAGNIVLVNSGSMVTGKITGTGLVSAVQRAIYPAAAAVTDVKLNVEVSNITFGVQPAPIAAAGSANDPKRWSGYIYAHDIVGTSGVSEGYGVLLESAEDCEFVVRAKNIRRHAVYLSAGARRNKVDLSVDGCGNYAAQFNSSSATQPACIHNTLTVRAVNLTTDVAGQSGALAILGNCHYNTCTVFCEGNATTYEAVRIEGGSGGVQGDHPKGNKIVNGAISGQFTGGDVIRMLNADGTHVRGNTIDAYAVTSVIGMRRTGTNLSLHGGYIEGNSINAQGNAIKGIYVEINTVPSWIGPNEIRNNGTALRVDDQTGGKRGGYSRRAVFRGTTASIAGTSSGDTTITLSDNIHTSGRSTFVTMTGGSGTYFNLPHTVVGVTAAPAENQTTFRIYNASGSAQTFNFEGCVEGD